MAEQLLSEDNVLELLDDLYNQALNGIGVIASSVENLADDYMAKAPNPQAAAWKMIDSRVLKCTTSGFLAGLGGILTLPVTVSANITSVLFVQLQMIATVAHMAGYDVKDDRVRAVVYACLAGISLTDIVKASEKKSDEKAAADRIHNISVEALEIMKRKAGIRFLAKFGEKSIAGMGRSIPLAGAILGGGVDYAQTRAIGARAYNAFFKDDFSMGEKKKRYRKGRKQRGDIQ